MNKESIIKFFKEHWGIILMNFIIFIILFFLIPLLFNYVNPNIWRTLFIITIALVTDIFYLKKYIKYDHVLFSIIILFILNILIIDYCTIRDLYGITSHGDLDKSPAIIDALLVDIVIVFLEYATLFITRIVKDVIDRRNKRLGKTKDNKK